MTINYVKRKIQEYASERYKDPNAEKFEVDEDIRCITEFVYWLGKEQFAEKKNKKKY